MKKIIIVCALATLTIAASAQEEQQAPMAPMAPDASAVEFEQATDTEAVEQTDTEAVEEINPLDTIQVPSVMAKSHFLLNFGGGMNTLYYQPANAKWLPGGGALAQVMYQFMITEKWGIGFGVGFSSMRSRTLFDNYEYTLVSTHPDNLKEYYGNIAINDEKEIQDMIAVDVPIQIFFRQPINDDWALHMGLGVTADVPVWSQFKAKKGYCTMTGDFYTPQGVVHIYPNVENHGFATTELASMPAKKFQYQTINVGLQGDFGATYRIAELHELYFGVYVNYQFASTTSPSESAVYNYKQLENDYVGVLNSNLVSAVNPLMAGVKLGFRLGTHDRAAEMALKQEKLAEYERIAKEEADSLAKIEAERLAREEAERLAREEAERIAREKAEREAREKAEAEQNAKQIAIVMQGVHFNSSSIEPIFDANADEALRNLSAYMAQNPNKRLLLTGHTDNTGSYSKNIEYGQRRADAYKSALIKKGIPGDKILTVSKGPDEPVATNDTPEGRAKNRRVEMVMLSY